MNNLELLTIKEVVEKLKVDRTTIYNWMKKGLPYLKIEGVLRFNEQELIDWVNRYKRNNQPHD